MSLKGQLATLNQQLASQAARHNQQMMQQMAQAAQQAQSQQQSMFMMMSMNQNRPAAAAPAPHYPYPPFQYPQFQYPPFGHGWPPQHDFLHSYGPPAAGYHVPPPYFQPHTQPVSNSSQMRQNRSPDHPSSFAYGYGGHQRPQHAIWSTSRATLVIPQMIMKCQTLMQFIQFNHIVMTVVLIISHVANALLRILDLYWTRTVQAINHSNNTTIKKSRAMLTRLSNLI